MPFKEKFAPQSLYHEVLKPTPDWKFVRVDENYEIPDGLCAICRDIQQSAYVVADLSFLNHNVFLELGMALGMGIPYVLLTQDIDELNRVFDVLRLRVIRYSRDEDNSTKVTNAEKLRTDILGRLQEGIHTSPQLRSEPITLAMANDKPFRFTEYLEQQDTELVKGLLVQLASARIIKSLRGKLAFHAKMDELSIRILISLLVRYPEQESLSELYQEVVDPAIQRKYAKPKGEVRRRIAELRKLNFIETHALGTGKYAISPENVDEVVGSIRGHPMILEWLG